MLSHWQAIGSYIVHISDQWCLAFNFASQLATVVPVALSEDFLGSGSSDICAILNWSTDLVQLAVNLDVLGEY